MNTLKKLIESEKELFLAKIGSEDAENEPASMYVDGLTWLEDVLTRIYKAGREDGKHSRDQEVYEASSNLEWQKLKSQYCSNLTTPKNPL